MEVYPLFSNPILCDIIDYDSKSINEYLEEINYEQYEYKNGYSSLDQKILLHEKFSEVRFIIENYINCFLFEILKFKQGKIKHSCSWINLHKTGDYAQTHNHPNSFISGILYLKVPSDCGKIYFSHPEEIPSYRTSTISPSIGEFNIYNSKVWSFEPKKNMLLIFPSHLSHGTDKNLSNLNRYSLAFNYFLEGNFGGDTTFLSL